jgi:hypothetical protein
MNKNDQIDDIQAIGLVDISVVCHFQYCYCRYIIVVVIIVNVYVYMKITLNQIMDLILMLNYVVIC